MFVSEGWRRCKEISSKVARRPSFGVLCCACGATLVLIFNVLFTIIATSQHKTNAGIATIKEGDCDATKRIDVWLHLLINILSTALLGASNYCMQCVSAPTRGDVDRAHAQHKWMDIGVPSVRNLWRISWPRKALWCFLFISSVPLHLTYNSVVFPGTSMSDYDMFMVSNDFLGNTVFDNQPTLTGWHILDDQLGRLKYMHDSLGNLQTLSPRKCFETFNAPIASAWTGVLVVSTYQNTSNPLLDATSSAFDRGDSGSGDTKEFECANDVLSTCNKADMAAAGTDSCFWIGYVPHSVDDSAPLDSEWCFPVSQCLGQKAIEYCSLRFRVPIMAAVIACKIIKVLCMAVLLWRVWKSDDIPLVTLGDAMASFLNDPGVILADFSIPHSALGVVSFGTD